MKIFTAVLMLLAIALIIYNATMLDFSNLFGKESSVALITILACGCALLLLFILRASKKVERKIKEQNTNL